MIGKNKEMVFTGSNYDQLKSFCGEHLVTTKNEWRKGYQLFVDNCLPHNVSYFSDVRRGSRVIRYSDGTFEVIEKG